MSEPFGTAEEIARMYRATVAYVQMRAGRDQWRRQGVRPQRYHLIDAHQSLHGRLRDAGARDSLGL